MKPAEALSILKRHKGRADSYAIYSDIWNIFGKIPKRTALRIVKQVLSGTLSIDLIESLLNQSEEKQRRENLANEFIVLNQRFHLKKLEGISEKIDSLCREFSSNLSEFFASWEGVEPKTLQQKQQIARIAQEVVMKIGYLFDCPACHRPARLRAVRSLSCENGVFQFIHSKGKRTTHQHGPSIPRLIPKKDD